MKAIRKAPGAGEQTGRKLITSGEYHALGLVQASIAWDVWEREAARLFREFWRSGDQKHLCAFSTQVVAMRIHQARAMQ